MLFLRTYNNQFHSLVRWHGSTGKYEGSYSHKHLEEWAQQIKQYTSTGMDVFCYFNNTDVGAAAAKDAKYLEQCVLNK